MTNSFKSPQSPAGQAWDQAVTVFTRWIGPIEKAAAQTARQRFLAYCQTCSGQPGFDKAAPLIAFGFLTRVAFEDAERKSRIYR